MSNVRESSLRSWTCFAFFSLLILVGFLSAALFQKQPQGQRRGLSYNNYMNGETKSHAEAHQILVESLDLFRDILANIAAQGKSAFFDLSCTKY